jgi:cytochrome c-type protein NapC
MSNDQAGERSMLARARRWITHPFSLIGGGFMLVFVGVAVAAAFVGGFSVFSDYTNRLEFCISCHEMERSPYAEYRKSIHFSNRTGVRAECKDCHVPQEFGPKLIAKIVAAKDIWHHVMGTIDTPEKFEEHRLVMAKRVWARMEETESRECRNCHAFQAMNLDEQGRRAKIKHPTAMQDGKHCIDCHKGIVHELPKGFEN